MTGSSYKDFFLSEVFLRNFQISLEGFKIGDLLLSNRVDSERDRKLDQDVASGDKIHMKPTFIQNDASFQQRDGNNCDSTASPELTRRCSNSNYECFGMPCLRSSLLEYEVPSRNELNELQFDNEVDISPILTRSSKTDKLESSYCNDLAINSFEVTMNPSFWINDTIIFDETDASLKVIAHFSIQRNQL